MVTHHRNSHWITLNEKLDTSTHSLQDNSLVVLSLRLVGGAGHTEQKYGSMHQTQLSFPSLSLRVSIGWLARALVQLALHCNQQINSNTSIDIKTMRECALGIGLTGSDRNIFLFLRSQIRTVESDEPLAKYRLLRSRQPVVKSPSSNEKCQI